MRGKRTQRQDETRLTACIAFNYPSFSSQGTVAGSDTPIHSDTSLSCAVVIVTTAPKLG